MDNPIDGILPDFDVFGIEFTNWWQKLFGGLWAAMILLSIAWLLVAFFGLRRATSNNQVQQVDESKSKVMWAGITLIAVLGFSVIVGIIINLSSTS